MKKYNVLIGIFLLLSCYERDNPVDPGAVNWVPPTAQLVISTQPQSQEISAGQNVTFGIVASGNPSGYQWKKNGHDISGAVYSIYTINAVQPNDSGGYTVIVSGNGMSVESDTAVLKVLYEPVIMTQPLAQTKSTGSNCTLSVVVNGYPPPSYQWKKNNQNITGAALSAFIIKSVQRSDSGAYTVVVSNNQGSATSVSALLTVNYVPVITTQPLTQTKAVGTSCTLRVVAAGCPLPNYQWNKNGSAITGATQSTFSIGSIQRNDSGSYTVVVSNSQGKDTSAVAAIMVNYTPIITSQPQPKSQTRNAGDSVSFNVSAIGYPAAISYQWQKNNVNIPGATQPRYPITSIQRSDSGTYAVVVSNSQGTVTSATVALMVNYLPIITTQPLAQTKAVGASCSLCVVAAGFPPPTYQWTKNGTAISGATYPTFSLGSIQRSDSGSYSVIVSNSQGNDTSVSAALMVNYLSIISQPQPQSQTLNTGDSISFSVLAIGYPAAISYQWQKNNVNIPGATQSIFSIASVQRGDSGSYKVVVSNNQESITSTDAAFMVNYAPIIFTQPQSQIKPFRANCTLSVIAAGHPLPIYQWSKNGSVISGATSNSYSISNLQASDSGSTFVVEVSNSQGSVLSNAATITTYTITATDIDGNVYHGVTIGNQVWMVENLKTTRFNDGSAISLLTPDSTWAGYCWYNNDSATYGKIYGALYNWYAVNTGKLAPIGWHVPTDAEWNTLINYLGDDNVAGGPLKDTGTIYWNSPNTQATNSSGFFALPGGYCDDAGGFSNVGNRGYWWSTWTVDITDSWYRYIGYDDEYILRSYFKNVYGLSVRCIKDN
jgi:Immunoglobulin I-set domain./Fibrobacter succinogenes major domain (Fib_succ_major).